MIRSVLAVVPDVGKFVCAHVKEDGSLTLQTTSDWKTLLGGLLKDAKSAAGFRALVPPPGTVLENEADLPYFVWPPTWSSSDQDFWLEFIRKALKEEKIKFPPQLDLDLNLLAKTAISKKVSKWSSIAIDRELRYNRLYATLLGFKAVAMLQKARPTRVKLKAKEINSGTAEAPPSP